MATVTTLAALLATRSSPRRSLSPARALRREQLDRRPARAHPGRMQPIRALQPTAQPSGTAGDNTQSRSKSSQSDLQNAAGARQQQGFYKNAQVDGKWGPHTRRAVQSFQHAVARACQASGHLDQQTLAALGVNKQGG